MLAAAAGVLVWPSLTLQIQAHAQTATSPPTASAAAAIPRHADGSINFEKWLSGRTPDELRGLSRQLPSRRDKEDFSNFLHRQGEALDKELLRIQEENRRMDKTIAALNAIEAFQSKLKAGLVLTQQERAQLKDALETEGVLQEIRTKMMPFTK